MTFFGDFRGGAAMERKLHESVPSMTVPLAGARRRLRGRRLRRGAGGARRREPDRALPRAGDLRRGTPRRRGPPRLGRRRVRLHGGVGGSRRPSGSGSPGARYGARPTADAALAGRPGYRLLLNKYFVDEFYEATAVGGTLRGGERLYRLDQRVVDGAVNGAASVTRLSGDLSDLSDQNLVDRTVNPGRRDPGRRLGPFPPSPDRALPELRPSHAVRGGPARRGPLPVGLSFASGLTHHSPIQEA